MQELYNKINEYREIKNNKEAICQKAEARIMTKINERFSELKFKFEQELNESMERVQQQYQFIEQGYTHELELSLRYVDLKRIGDELRKMFDEKQKIPLKEKSNFLKKKLDEIDNYFKQTSSVQQKLDKFDALDFVPSDSNEFELKNKFGSFKQHSSFMNDWANFMQELQKSTPPVSTVETIQAKLPKLSSLNLAKTIDAHFYDITGLR
jgi:hypothetical protein